ncbi:MAG: tryptophan 2,3-dioxygenase family protein [Solirubrobacterales bacterium]|jgi:tryptophan 2,3-dioxygenase
MPKDTGVDYGEYLRLSDLLGCQSPKSAELGRPAHDEMLFVVVHQVYELWFKQILHELDSVMGLFRSDLVDEKSIGVAAARLTRVTEIQKILVDQLHVLETMTPLDFLEFRDLLVPASGFQSWQFRLIENKLGLRSAGRVAMERSPAGARLGAAEAEALRDSVAAPSLFDLVEKWLERTPFLEVPGYQFWESYGAAVRGMLATDRRTIEDNPTLSDVEKQVQLTALGQTEASFKAVLDEKAHEALVAEGRRRLSHRATRAALFIHLYRDQPILHMPFRFLTLLVDVDELFSTWRYRHALMVHRMIGTKIGTGGSSGHGYLLATVEKNKIFTDLYDLSTCLISRSALPPLPPEMERRLGFYYPRQ